MYDFDADAARKVWYECVVSGQRSAGVPNRTCNGIRTLWFSLILLLLRLGRVLVLAMLLAIGVLTGEGRRRRKWPSEDTYFACGKPSA